MRDGDKVLAVNGTPVTNWDELKKAVGAHPGEPIDVTVERDGHDARTPR